MEPLNQPQKPFDVSGRKPDGSLDLDVPTINMLHNKYIETTHPIQSRQERRELFDPQQLRKLFDLFITEHCEGYENMRLKFALGDNTEVEQSLHQQRPSNSTKADQDEIACYRKSSLLSSQFSIVYLVLALGKSWKVGDLMPGPHTVQRQLTQTSGPAQEEEVDECDSHGTSSPTGDTKSLSVSPEPAQGRQSWLRDLDKFRTNLRSQSPPPGSVPTPVVSACDELPGSAYYERGNEALRGLDGSSAPAFTYIVWLMVAWKLGQCHFE